MTNSKFIIYSLSFSILTFFLVSCAETDPRAIALNEAISKMTNTPPEADAIAIGLKTILGIAKMDGFGVDRFKYYTDSTDSKALVLVKIPELSSVAQDARMTFLNLTDQMTDQGGWKAKDKYIGIFGGGGLMMVKTPDGIKNRSSMTNTNLYGYFEEVAKEE